MWTNDVLLYTYKQNVYKSNTYKSAITSIQGAAINNVLWVQLFSSLTLMWLTPKNKHFVSLNRVQTQTNSEDSWPSFITAHRLTNENVFTIKWSMEHLQN